MSNLSKKISELINTPGKNAPDMNSALKTIGDGDMYSGLKKLADYYTAVGNEQGYADGDRNGTIKGALVTLLLLGVIGGGIYIKNRCTARRQKKLDAEGDKILKAFKDSVPIQDSSDEDCTSLSEESKEIPTIDIQQKD